MKFKDYFIDKIFSVICFIITEILIVGLLWLIEVRTIFIIFSVSIIFVFFTFALLWDFGRRSKYYNQLLKLLNQLDEKTLLLEIVERPYFLDGQIISSILKQNNKYQNDKIAEMQKQYREYRDFLDTWVHEIKTPITSARLIVENEKNPVTLKIDDELRKIDHYVELVLYYARSSDVLNCISTIDSVTSGHIYVEGKDITTLHGGQLSDFRGQKLGFIFQDFNLLDTLTAEENISLSLSIAGVKPAQIQKRVRQIAEALNISEVLSKYPYQMSGGQQQRVAAARAIVADPAIVLADEPTGALDSNSSRMLLTMLTELNERLDATILMVTHDAFSASYCRRILFIKDGKIFNELNRGNDSRKDFFAKILEVVSVLGGEQNDLV